MIVKDISFDNEARQRLISGVNKIADAVKSTLGARGKTVLIESENHVGGVTITKDGVTVAKSINLLEPTENLAVRIVREAAERTSNEAGDGTTTAIVLTQAIIEAAQEYIKPQLLVEEASYEYTLTLQANRRVNTILSNEKLKSTGYHPRTAKEALKWTLQNYE